MKYIYLMILCAALVCNNLAFSNHKNRPFQTDSSHNYLLVQSDSIVQEKINIKLHKLKKQTKASNQNNIKTIPTKLGCKHDSKNFRCVQYIKNYDGDTITFYIPHVHPIIGKEIRVRLLNIDTPEMNAKNSCEKRKAKEAQKKVEILLKNAKRIDLENIKRGRYFRIVADVKMDGLYLAEELIKNNLAYYYKGKNKKQIDWCAEFLNPGHKGK